jgi:hypothetical protein
MSLRRWQPTENRARIASKDRELLALCQTASVRSNYAGECDAGDWYLQRSEQVTKRAHGVVADLSSRGDDGRSTSFHRPSQQPGAGRGAVLPCVRSHPPGAPTGGQPLEQVHRRP